MTDTEAATYDAWMDQLCAAATVPTDAVTAVPDEAFELMGVFADWCEDQGLACCEALRWLARLRKAPRYYLVHKDWNWDRGDHGCGYRVTKTPIHQEDIPKSLWLLMPGRGRNGADGYTTARDAYEDFFAGFEKWPERDRHGVKPMEVEG